ncbi:MAG TPA: SCO family protein [Polyangiaceae bacterium]|jgi:protein SCO1/2
MPISRANARRRVALHALSVLVLVVSAIGFGGCAHRREPLPVLGQLGAFALVDQGGKPITAESLRGTVWVADFFFTHCPTICPRITRRMRALQVAAGGKPIRFMSFSVDPENDTPPVLLAYAKQYGADLRTWSFLTGDLAVVKATIVDGFKLALDGKPDLSAANGGIIHGSHLVLVDRNLKIRGYYRSDDDEEMKRLLEDASGL